MGIIIGRVGGIVSSGIRFGYGRIRGGFLKERVVFK